MTAMGMDQGVLYTRSENADFEEVTGLSIFWI
jgi:hypothetical protein